jgi:hypothetical protein
MKTPMTKLKLLTTKCLALTLTLVLLSCLTALGQPYPIPVLGANSFTLLGSQFDPPYTVEGYDFLPTANDMVIVWDFSAQAFAPGYTYSSRAGAWNPQNEPLPLGQAFLYYNNGPAARTIYKPLNNNTPTPVTLIPNKYYLLSSQHAGPSTPDNAVYADLSGGTPPANETYVWLWNSMLNDWELPLIYEPTAITEWQSPIGLGGHGAKPSIPFGGGALVAWFHGDAAPVQTVSVAPGCPPTVTLTVTYDNPVDPITALNPYSYEIFAGNATCGIGTAPAGAVVPGTVSLQWTPSGGSLPPVVQSVQLTVTLMDQPCTTYYLKGGTSRGGTAIVPTSFTPFTAICTVPPSNDQPSSATPIFDANTLAGCLTCATATDDGSLAAFPAGSGLHSVDVWYKYSSPLPGHVTIDTCTPPISCPANTVLAVYWGTGGNGTTIPTALAPVPGTWNNGVGAPNCGPLTFKVEACTDYYIRVSAFGNQVQGNFNLHLTFAQDLLPALRDECATTASALLPNTSTFFDNSLATTSAGIPGPAMENDVWFRFITPACATSVTLDTCKSTFASTLAMFSGGCGALVLISPTLGACPSGFFGYRATFPVSPSTQYRVRVGGVTSTDRGCGFLRIECGIPALVGTLSTCPTTSSAKKRFQIFGLPNPPGGGGWYWSLTAPCCMNLSGQVLPGAVAGGSTGTAADIAAAFAASINSAAAIANASCTTPLVVPPYSYSDSPANVAFMDVRTACGASSPMVLKVGATSADCWVDNGLFVLDNGPLSPCVFNPAIFEIGDPSEDAPDCNGNGQQDYVDILTGGSADVDGNGVPDECQACVPAVITDGPASTLGYFGGPATLAVQTAGTGPLSYQWRKDGTPLSGQTGATLVFTNLAFDASGLYDVMVTNACGPATSPSAVLAVDPQPYLNIATAGTNVVLSWSASAYHLQISPALGDGASWSDLPDASPATAAIGVAARYFRLQAAP